jgi:uncharacterized phage protein (TIGR02220 family)
MNISAKVLKTLLKRPIAFHRVFVDVAGDALSGLFLSQAFYWSQQQEWFYKTQKQWRDETGMTRCEQERARAKLKKKGILEEKYAGVPCRVYYRLNMDTLVAALNACTEAVDTSLLKTDTLDCQKPASKDAELQQTTAETSPETSAETTPGSLGGARETKDDHAREESALDGNDPADGQPEVSTDAGVSHQAPCQTPGPEGPATAPGVPDPLAAAFAPASAALDEVARAVLAYLNQVTGRQYGSVSLEPALWGIKARLLDGATHEDCYLVIDFCKAVLDVEQPGFADRRLNTQTPWKPDLFDTYINRARAWHAKGRPPATPPDAGRPRRARRRDLVITNGLPTNGVLSNDRTRANVEAAQRGLARLQEEWSHDA